MIGLYIAVSDYLTLDQKKEWERMSGMVDKIITSLSTFDTVSAYRCEHGSVGQAYPRVLIKVSDAMKMIDSMRARHVFIGYSNENEVYISTQNLYVDECEEVITALKEAIKEI
jgi:type II secretory pathway component GspD/PulD (secretin)